MNTMAYKCRHCPYKHENLFQIIWHQTRWHVQRMPDCYSIKPEFLVSAELAKTFETILLNLLDSTNAPCSTLTSMDTENYGNEETNNQNAPFMCPFCLNIYLGYKCLQHHIDTICFCKGSSYAHCYRNTIFSYASCTPNEFFAGTLTRRPQIIECIHCHRVCDLMKHRECTQNCDHECTGPSSRKTFVILTRWVVMLVGKTILLKWKTYQKKDLRHRIKESAVCSSIKDLLASNPHIFACVLDFHRPNRNDGRFFGIYREDLEMESKEENRAMSVTELPQKLRIQRFGHISPNERY